MLRRRRKIIASSDLSSRPASTRDIEALAGKAHEDLFEIRRLDPEAAHADPGGDERRNHGFRLGGPQHAACPGVGSARVREFETALERLGVVPVPSVGERFDPAVHDAIAAEESDDVKEDTVVAELVPGYRLHDRLLRPAVVRVVQPRTVPSGS